MPGRPVNDPTKTWHWRSVVRPAVLARDGHRCQIGGPGCGGTATQVDHTVPWRVGGAWFDMDNLRAACGTCNSRRAFRRSMQTVRPSREW